MSGKRDVLESEIQRRIEVDLGAEPDYLLLRNSVGKAKHFNESTGTTWHVPYGLGVGSPDIVGILRVLSMLDGFTKLTPFGLWLCMEVKCPGEDATDEQKHCHDIWRGFGAIVEVVHSVDEARDVLVGVRALVGVPA